MLLFGTWFFIQECAIALICVWNGYRGTRIHGGGNGTGARDCFTRDETGAERCMVHLLALVHLSVTDQLSLLLLKLEVSNRLRSRSRTTSIILKRFQSCGQILI